MGSSGLGTAAASRETGVAVLPSPETHSWDMRRPDQGHSQLDAASPGADGVTLFLGATMCLSVTREDALLAWDVVFL